jgi:hypothetical protein
VLQPARGRGGWCCASAQLAPKKTHVTFSEADVLAGGQGALQTAVAAGLCVQRGPCLLLLVVSASIMTARWHCMSAWGDVAAWLLQTLL